MGTKKGRIYGKGAPFKGAPQRFGGEVAPDFPLLDRPLDYSLVLFRSLHHYRPGLTILTRK